MAEQTSASRTQAAAHLKFARMGPRKLRRIADAIRGKSVREALVLLKFADVYAAAPMEKLVKSAVANAGNNYDMNTDDLFVVKITVDGGPGGRFTKRLDPRAQGRAYFKRKRMSHVTVVVGEEPAASTRKARRGGASIGLRKKPVRHVAAPAHSAALAPAHSAAPAPVAKTVDPAPAAADGKEA